MKVFLIHVREHQKEIEFERLSVLRTCGFCDEELISIDFLSHGLPDNVLDTDVLIVGGSRFGVAVNAPEDHPKNLFMLVEIVREARKRKIPYMGLCFGGQLLAHAFGGKSINDKSREECGTFLISKTVESQDDLLFKELPLEFMAQCAHHDYIINLPEEAVWLAKSKMCPVQAFRIGNNMYGFQFHPERSKEAYEAIINFRLKDHGERVLRFAKLAPSPEAEKIPKKFIEIFARRN